MYSFDIVAVVVVIWLAWQLQLEDYRWADSVDRHNLVVAPRLDDGGAGQEAYSGVSSGWDGAHVREMSAVISVAVFHDVDDDGGRRHWALAVMLKEFLQAPEIVVGGVAIHAEASLPEVGRESHASHQYHHHHRRRRRHLFCP
jgi:hypothetical protein